MASPMPSQPNGGWNPNGQAMPPQQQYDDSGVQVRQVGLKVLYKFNREDKFDCLARPSQTFTVQTIPIDQSTTIGVIDLRQCIQAVVECSPELPGQECDYTVYAHDYSEPDTPLVGQGSLSMAMGSLHNDMGSEPKMVTGLLTTNKLGLLMGKNRETLEVKMKFTETPRAFRPQPQPHQAPQPQQQQPSFSQPSQERPRQDSFSQQRPFDRSLTPTGATEWNSFIQMNPQIGQQPSFSRGASPALSQTQHQPTHSRSNSFIQHPIPQALPQQDPSRTAPTPVEPNSEAGGQGQASRPSSRASNRGGTRKKAPTGRPRGRPRRKPVAGANTGNTSGYEDGTEGEEGPIKKRAKVTQVDTINNNPFGSEPDSLRVAASTSGSLRNFRPVGLTSEEPAGNHLQEVPRAPTPVPKGPFRGGGANKRKRPGESAMSREVPQTSPQSQKTRPQSPGQQDGRSPESTFAQTPAYSDHSPAEIGSSPPVPRTTSFMQSSPPPSSPMLPPMPDQAPPTDALEQEDMTDLFGDEPSQATAPAKPAPAPYNGVRKSKKPLPRPADISTPMQVWRMEDGPDGTQDLVHVHSYNQPDPTEPPKAQFRPLAPLPAAGVQYRSPMMVPTPPATTDATEKPTSPPQSDPPQSRNGLPEPEPPSFPFERPVNPPAEKPASPPAGQQYAQPGPTPEAGPTGLAYPQPYFAPLPQSAPAAPEQSQQPGAPQAPELQAQAQTSPNDVPCGPALPSVEAQAEAQSATSAKKKAPAKPRSRAKAPAKPRKLARSQSAGNLATVPASEPAGPSGLSQSIVAEPEPVVANPPVNLRRAQSTGPLNLPVPASDPVGPSFGLALPLPAMPEPIQPTVEPPSDAIPEPSSPRQNKNFVKRNAIKQRLEAAIKRGEMPPYCCNCGAIETPTWRKIFCQEYDGIPPTVRDEDFGSKPGMITTVDVIKEQTDEEPGRYRIVKKALALDSESVDDWQEKLLCNPCGIWLCKTFSYRPPDRWGGDAERLGKSRKRKASEPGSKPKRSRSKSTTQPPPTSEANIPPTDGPAPIEATPHADEDSAIMMEAANTTKANPIEIVNDENAQAAEEQRPVSTHSSGNGSAKSPVELELDAAMGATKRLLFPSPRKDNSPKALSDLDVNIVQTGDFRPHKENTSPRTVEKGTLAPPQGSAGKEGAGKAGDDLEDLFRSPAARPCTPPSVSKTGPPTTPFKTPTRGTPSHRPITRSVSRSLRSKGSALDTPSAAFRRTPSRTPSKTPRDEYALPGSALRRPSPRHQIMVDIDERLFDTPMSRAMNQMLSEPNFGIGDDEVDLVPSDSANWDSFNIFSTDGLLPSSPPRFTRFDETWESQPKEWRDFLSDIQTGNDADEERA